MAKVLLVDDLEFNLFALRTLLGHAGYQIAEAYSGQEALLKAQNEEIDTILLDTHMPGMDGFEVCTQLKADPATASIPVLFISGDTADQETVVRAFELGAVDYLTKPVNNSEILARVAKFTQLCESEKEARRQSMTDELTGLYNRRFATLRITEDLSRSNRRCTEACCLVLDIDHFKKINDAYGHTFGDGVLRTLARLLTSRVRAEDLVARYGGEEFVVFLPCPVTHACLTAERLRTAIGDHLFDCDGRSTRLTVSIGLGACSVGDGPITPEALFAQADEALYKAKERGRNCLVLSSRAQELARASTTPQPA